MKNHFASTLVKTSRTAVFLYALASVYFYTGAVQVWAAMAPPPGFINPIAYDDIWTFLQAVLQAVILIIFPLVVLMLVYTGFLFISAQGNEAKLTAARRAFFYTLIGALIVLGAQALSLAIEGTVNDIQNGVIQAPVQNMLAYEYTSTPHL